MLNLTTSEKEPTYIHEPGGALALSSLEKTETAIIPLSQAKTIAPEPSRPASVEEHAPTRLERALDFLHRYPKLTVIFTACAIATLSLGTWVGALFFENKVLKHRIAQQQQTAKAEAADEIKSRIDEAKTQMSQLQNQMEAQQTDVILTEQASLAGENARLLQDLNCKHQSNLTSQGSSIGGQ